MFHTSLKFLLPIFLLLIWNGGIVVECQSIETVQVKSQSVKVSWPRTGEWFGVEDFTVQFNVEDYSPCTQTVNCGSVTCYFNSSSCGIVSACSVTNTTVTGNDYTADSLILTTAPDVITNLKLSQENGTEHITWNNPDKNSLTCHSQTTINVYFKSTWKMFTTSLPNTKTSVDIDLCARDGPYTVVVLAEGGDGWSDTTKSFTYDSFDVVHVVEITSVEAAGCNNVSVSWKINNPDCVAGDIVEVAVDDWHKNVTTNNSNTIMPTDSHHYHQACATVWTTTEFKDIVCQFYYNPASDVLVRNVRYEPVTDHSLEVSWDLPVCEDLDYVYEVTYTPSYHYSETTREQSLVLYSMHDFEYNVCVKTHGSDPTYEPPCITAYTLVDEPSYLYGSTFDNGTVLMTWEYYYQSYANFTIIFLVTWTNYRDEHPVQYNATTQEESYLITENISRGTNYNITVQAYPKENKDLMSATRYTFEYVPHAYSSNAGLIAGVTVGCVVAVVLVVSAGWMFHKRSRRNTSVTTPQVTQRT